MRSVLERALKLSDCALRVAAGMVVAGNNATVRELAKTCCVTERTVYRGKNELRDAGILSVAWISLTDSPRQKLTGVSQIDSGDRVTGVTGGDSRDMTADDKNCQVTTKTDSAVRVDEVVPIRSIVKTELPSEVITRKARTRKPAKPLDVALEIQGLVDHIHALRAERLPSLPTPPSLTRNGYFQLLKAVKRVDPDLGVACARLRDAVSRSWEHRYWAGKITLASQLTWNLDRLLADLETGKAGHRNPSPSKPKPVLWEDLTLAEQTAMWEAERQRREQGATN